MLKLDKSTWHLTLQIWAFWFSMKQKQNVEMIIPCNMERTQTVIEVYDLNHKSTYIYIYVVFCLQQEVVAEIKSHPGLNTRSRCK